MSNLFQTFKRLFPRSLAWKMPFNSNLKKYVEGLSEMPSDIKDFADNVYLDIFPETTRELDRWEKQFNLTPSGTDQERRDNLAARWAARGGQGKDYLESIIHAAGFTGVFLHEWWNDDGTTKNPNFFLQSSSIVYEYYTGKPGAQSGDGVSQSAGSRSISDYPYYTNKLNSQSGDGVTQSSAENIPFLAYFYYTGKPGAQSGDGVSQSAGLIPTPEGRLLVNKGPNISYQVPQTLDSYRNMLYVGGETFPDLADVSIDRKEEFERLLLKYLPYSNWIGLLINYV